MRIKSYFSRTIEQAISTARQELGEDAVLISSREAPVEVRHLGEYEVVFGEAEHYAKPLVGKNQPPVATSPGSGDRLAGEIAAMKAQLENMRQVLMKAGGAPPLWLGGPPFLSEAYATLTANEVAPELARHIVESAAARLAGTRGQAADAGEWPTALEEEMRSRLRVDGALGAASDGGGAECRHIVALIGPPGAGKTSALVKLALARGVASRKSLLLVSIDNCRVGAADQLRCYAAILGVSFQMADTISALAQIIEENRNKDFLFLDTPGLDVEDIEDHAEIGRFLASRNDIDRHLVLPASMKAFDLSRIVEAFQLFRPRRLLFTRLDETSCLGSIFSEAARTRNPLSFFSTGQRIPEDLEPATQDRVLESILGRTAETAVSAA